MSWLCYGILTKANYATQSQQAYSGLKKQAFVYPNSDATNQFTKLIAI